MKTVTAIVVKISEQIENGSGMVSLNFGQNWAKSRSLSPVLLYATEACPFLARDQSSDFRCDSCLNEKFSH